MRLNNKVVLVTGAGSGIGRAVAIKSAEEGADVILADIKADTLVTAAEAIKKLGRKSLSFAMDICDAEAIKAVMDAAVKEFGHIDALANCAGIFAGAPFLEITEADWDRTMNINVKGSFLCAQAFIRQAVDNNTPGSIVFFSSISGYIVYANSAQYNASKGAVRQLSKSVAFEFGPKQIRSNIIAPGTIATPMNSWIIDDAPHRERCLASIPMGRLGEPEEVASVTVFLMSDDSSYCTGAEILVDAGQITHC